MTDTTKEIILNTPLNLRGYLLYKAERMCMSIYKVHTSYYSPLGIMSILYLYGAEFKSVEYFNLEKTHEENKEYLDFYKTPQIIFSYRDKPLIFNDNESEIISKILKENNHNTWYPYNWSTDEGENLRLRANLDAENLTNEAKDWVTKFDILKNLFDNLFSNFIKDNVQNKTFKIKWGCDENEIWLKIVDDEYANFISEDAIRERQYEYIKLIRDFSIYLYEGFLKESPTFKKCLYE